MVTATEKVIGSFSNDDGRRQRKRHLKINICAIVTIRHCHILFAFYNVAKVSYNWTDVRAVELDTEN